jgi:hypothetical protein
MLKNISSMSKEDKELLEIPEFLKKLSKEQPQNEKSSTVVQDQKFIPITTFQEKETEVVKSKPKIDIQAKIKEHTQNYYIDIKDIIDQMTENEKTESVYEYCKEHNIALTYCGKLLELVNEYKQEPCIGLQARTVRQDERTEEQQDLYEAYHSFNTKEMNSMIAVFDQAVSDIERWATIKQGEKKARKPRAISVERMIKKLQYKQADERYKLQSIDPILIPRCQMVWVFNTKTRKLTQYNAVGRNGIMVKGTTLKDYDTDMSVSKTVRKPDQVLSKLLNTDGKIAMRNIWNTLTTTETKANGRINADTIILKVIK